MELPAPAAADPARGGRGGATLDEDDLFAPRVPAAPAAAAGDRASRAAARRAARRRARPRRRRLRGVPVRAARRVGVTIPELGTIRATHPPIVVLTSNRTRDLHDALKRRCLYHWIDYPAAGARGRDRAPPRARGGASARGRRRGGGAPAARERRAEAARHRRGDRLGRRARAARRRPARRGRRRTGRSASVLKYREDQERGARRAGSSGWSGDARCAEHVVRPRRAASRRALGRTLHDARACPSTPERAGAVRAARCALAPPASRDAPLLDGARRVSSPHRDQVDGLRRRLRAASSTAWPTRPDAAATRTRRRCRRRARGDRRADAGAAAAAASLAGAAAPARPRERRAGADDGPRARRCRSPRAAPRSACATATSRTCDADELGAAPRSCAELARRRPAAPTPARARGARAATRLDVRAMLRAAHRTGGDPVAPDPCAGARARPRRLVVLCDVSGVDGAVHPRLPARSCTARSAAPTPRRSSSRPG